MIDGQLTILDHPALTARPQRRPRARRNDPSTSHAAAAGAEHAASGVESAIVDVFALAVAADGFTDDELCARLPDLYAPTVKTARSRLTKRHVLVAAGVTRPSARGREQLVWRLAVR